MVDENTQQPTGLPPYAHQPGYHDDAPTEIAPSAYATPQEYESPTQTAGPGYGQRNAGRASYSETAHQSSQSGYPTGQYPHYQTTPYGGHPYSGASTTNSRSKKGGVTGWILGMVLVLVAIVVFAVVWLILPKHNDSKNSTSPSAGATSTNKGKSAPTTSDDVIAPFPAEANGNCTGAGTLPNDVRLVGNSTSCGYVTSIEKQIVAKLQQDPASTNYPVEAYSSLVDRVVSLECNRLNHLSHCVGGNQVNIYLQDSIH